MSNRNMNLIIEGISEAKKKEVEKNTYKPYKMKSPVSSGDFSDYLEEVIDAAHDSYMDDDRFTARAAAEGIMNYFFDNMCDKKDFESLRDAFKLFKEVVQVEAYEMAFFLSGAWGSGLSRDIDKMGKYVKSHTPKENHKVVDKLVSTLKSSVMGFEDVGQSAVDAYSEDNPFEFDRRQAAELINNGIVSVVSLGSMITI